MNIKIFQLYVSVLFPPCIINVHWVFFRAVQCYKAGKRRLKSKMETEMRKIHCRHFFQIKLFASCVQRIVFQCLEVLSAAWLIPPDFHVPHVSQLCVSHSWTGSHGSDQSQGQQVTVPPSPGPTITGQLADKADTKEMQAKQRSCLGQYSEEIWVDQFAAMIGTRSWLIQAILETF